MLILMKFALSKKIFVILLILSFILLSAFKYLNSKYYGFAGYERYNLNNRIFEVKSHTSVNDNKHKLSLVDFRVVTDVQSSPDLGIALFEGENLIEVYNIKENGEIINLADTTIDECDKCGDDISPLIKSLSTKEIVVDKTQEKHLDNIIDVIGNVLCAISLLDLVLLSSGFYKLCKRKLKMRRTMIHD